MKLAYQELEQGIACIETYYQRPSLACCYLVREGDEAALIDTGTARNVPLIMELLARYGLSADHTLSLPMFISITQEGRGN